VAELPEKLMSCRFLPMSCWFVPRGADRLEGIAPLKQRELSRVVMPGRVRPAPLGLVHRTPGISCERPICSTLVCFIPLFGGGAALSR
jgi:hypothetical protein